MATLQTDAVIELLPVRQLPDGYHATVRLLAAGALPLTLPSVGPAATLESLGDALASVLATHAAPEPGSVAQSGACRRLARQRTRRSSTLRGACGRSPPRVSTA